MYQDSFKLQYVVLCLCIILTFFIIYVRSFLCQTKTTSRIWMALFFSMKIPSLCLLGSIQVVITSGITKTGTDIKTRLSCTNMELSKLLFMNQSHKQWSSNNTLELVSVDMWLKYLKLTCNLIYWNQQVAYMRITKINILTLTMDMWPDLGKRAKFTHPIFRLQWPLKFLMNDR